MPEGSHRLAWRRVLFNIADQSETEGEDKIIRRMR